MSIHRTADAQAPSCRHGVIFLLLAVAAIFVLLTIHAPRTDRMAATDVVSDPFAEGHRR
jgi:hypothetical protein